MNNYNIGDDGLDFLKKLCKDSTIIFINNGNTIGYAQNVNAGGGGKPDFVTPVKAFKAVIAQMNDEEMFLDIQDLCYIYYIDTDFTGAGFTSINNFCDRITRLVPDDFDRKLIPNANNFKSLDLGSKPFPDWNWESVSDKKVNHVKSLGNTYIHLMAAKGYSHPMLVEKES